MYMYVNTVEVGGGGGGVCLIHFRWRPEIEMKFVYDGKYHTVELLKLKAKFSQTGFMHI